MSTVIKIENLGKQYRLGVINRSMLYDDIQRKIARFMGKKHLAQRIDQAGRLIEDDNSDMPSHIWALRDVSLDIKDGDVLGIIGRNGSGKSTLLKIITRITAPTEGRIEVHGRVASLLEVGTGFHDELTGRENIFLNGTILGMRSEQIKKHLDAIIDFSGVEKFIDTPTKRYSSGMRVRLAFAVAAHLDPDILIIDEVLAVGDAAFQSKCLNKIGEVSRDGRTVLFVSHQSSAVEHLCTKGVVLDEGKLMFQGSQSEALDYYVQSIQTRKVPLADRKDRRGTGTLRVNDITFRRDGRSCTTMTAGVATEILLHFEQIKKRDYNNLKVEVRITTLFDAPVFCQHNQLNGVDFSRLPEKGVFVCKIPKLPLPSGTYRLAYLIRANMDYEMVDMLEGAADLNVEGGKFFLQGELPDVHNGVALVDAEWSIENV